MSSKVVYAQEEANAAGVLVSNNCGLALAIRTAQEQPRLGARRPYDNPALRATVRGDGGRVFHELELQYVDEEPDRRIVVMDHHRYKLEKGHRCTYDITIGSTAKR